MHILGTNKFKMIKTLFLPLQQSEVKQQQQNIHDKRDRIETKHKKFDVNSLSELTIRNNSELEKLDTHLKAFHLKNNIEGGYSIVSVTPVLETKAEKVDNDEPMMPFVTTTGFLIILHKEDTLGQVIPNLP